MNKFVEKYGQILLPLVTPYDENENVKYDTYAELIEYLIEKDMCDSLIVTGTTGEASLLTFDERVKLFETAVKASAEGNRYCRYRMCFNERNDRIDKRGGEAGDRNVSDRVSVL